MTSSRSSLPRDSAKPDEDLRALPRAETVVEFGDRALPQDFAELEKAARLLGDLHGEQRFARLAEIRAFGHVAQLVEIHVGAAVDGDDALVLPVVQRAILLDARHRQRTGGLDDGARVFEDVLDAGADFVGVDQHDFVDVLAAQAEGFFADALHRHAVGKDARRDRASRASSRAVNRAWPRHPPARRR